MWLPQNISSNIAETMLVDAVRTFSQSMEQAVDNAIAFAEKEASSQGSQAPLEALRSKDGAAVHPILLCHLLLLPAYVASTFDLVASAYPYSTLPFPVFSCPYSSSNILGSPSVLPSPSSPFPSLVGC